ncbi:flagellar basal body L-ring protein FlgH [Sphingomonas oryzagri]|jgi:flagellar L-ring protein precursor FlgH|uniref:Flagellar L-ring protein n=1 Tax=Sphingomonas oryzagri TaxID=3042314 RepID=A0ABT6N2X4_9SPHN|nr:flagellar basal body L-ring protein FlgH [Sphingomonas oryzagri]MDH7639640.1 flagellar basal body L-ring protein FlgH [Sphingomonas oryzagri]
MIRTFALSASLLGLAATLAVATPADARKKKQDNQVTDFTATMPAAPVAPPADGAIFHASYGYAALTSGARAAMVGDLVTIQLVEATQAQKSNSADTTRTSNIGLTPPTTGPLSFFSSTDASMGGSGTFKGKGDAAQSNALTGNITVTIAQVLPNNVYLIRGEKHLTLNRGDEVIQIAGLIRAADIDSTNTVLSTRVANAQINYTGKGEIARASTQGWLGRFFSRVSPF